jgi:DNA-binding transcriptional LysR family regulator
LLARYPAATFEYHACEEERAQALVQTGEAHLALVTGEIFPGLSAQIRAETQFVTVAGPGHPLYGRRKPIAVEEILEHAFVSPSHPILGKVGLKQSLDGWRDDQFTRKVGYLTASLKMLEVLVTEGRALAYLPDYHAAGLEVRVLEVTGCPYSCAQKIRLVARRPKETGWLNALFGK